MTPQLPVSFLKGYIPYFFLALFLFPLTAKASPISGLNCNPTANIIASADPASADDGSIPQTLTVCSPNPSPTPNPAPSPLPAVTFSHGSLDFGDHEVMKEGHVLSMTMASNLYNLSQVIVDVNGVSGDFKAHSHCDQLPVGHSCEIEVRFTPHAANLSNDILTVTYFYQGGAPPNVPGNLNVNPRINPQTLTGYSTVTLTGTGVAVADICGDGTVDSGEECDDGNTANGDSCSATCTLENSINSQSPNPSAAAGGCSIGGAMGGEGSFAGGGIVLMAGLIARIMKRARRKD